MRLSLPYFIAAFCLFLPLTAAHSESLSLEDCFKLAVVQSESLERKELDIKRAEAVYQEAVSALYPSVHAIGNQRWRNSERFGRVTGSSTTIGNEGPGGSVTSGSSQSKHPAEAMFNVKQPLFTGFRDQFIARATKSRIEALGFEKTRARELLFQDLSTVFHQTRYYEEDLKLLKKSRGVFDRRIKELQDFINLGKSRESELEAARSQLAQLLATSARVEGLWSASKEMVAFLVGRDSSTFDLIPLDKSSLNLLSLDELIVQGKVRADVQAADLNQKSAFQERRAAEREKWPLLSVEGNFYPYEDPDTNRDWDVLMKLDVPLYEGGGIEARIAQSRADELSAKAAMRETRRIAEREIRVAFSQIKSSQKEVSQLESLVSTSRKNYESQTADYKNGVVTNLDVLNAITTVQDAERSLLEARTNLLINQDKLQVAVGGLPQ